jgi:hypothetical protein
VVCESFLLIWLFLKDTKLCVWFCSIIYFLVGVLYVFFIIKVLSQKMEKKNGVFSLPRQWNQHLKSSQNFICWYWLNQMPVFLSLQLEYFEWTTVVCLGYMCSNICHLARHAPMNEKLYVNTWQISLNFLCVATAELFVLAKWPIQHVLRLDQTALQPLHVNYVLNKSCVCWNIID